MASITAIANGESGLSVRTKLNQAIDEANKVDGKADTVHTHAISDVTALETTLTGKADVGHTHAISDVTDLQTALDGKAATTHVHAISDVTDLQLELDGKAPTVHTHTISDVTDLQTALDGKAATEHTHAIADVTGLQAALDGKALDSTISLVGKSGEYSDLLNKPDLSALAGMVQVADFASLPPTGDSNTVYITQDTGYLYRWSGVDYVQLTDETAIWGQVSGILSNQTDLQTVLEGKAPTVHTHAISGVTNLQTTLDSKLSKAGRQQLDPSFSVYRDNHYVGFDTEGTIIGSYTAIGPFISNTPRFRFDKNGEMTMLTAGAGITLTSPNGTSYKLTVSDDGTLVTEAAV